MFFHHRFHAVGEHVGFAVGPGAGQLAGGVAARRMGDVGVRPYRLGTGWRAGGIGLVHLAHQHEGVGGKLTAGEIGRIGADAVHGVAEMDGAGVRGGLHAPRNRSGECPVDLEGAMVPLEPLQ